MTEISPPLPPLTKTPDTKRIAGAAIAALLSVLGVLFLDAKYEFHLLEEPLLYVGRNFKIDGYFDFTQELGAYFALILVFWAVCVLAPTRRAYLGSLLIALIISGAIVGVAKEGFGRARPDYSVLVDDERQAGKKRDMMELANEYPHLNFKRDDRGGVVNQSIWLLWDRPIGLIGKNWFTSYPSGHANQGMVLAVFLTAICVGRGKVLWYVLGVGCALARVRYERHFPTDILMGGAIGYLVAHWVLSWHWPVRMGAWIFRARPPDPQ